MSDWVTLRVKLAVAVADDVESCDRDWLLVPTVDVCDGVVEKLAETDGVEVVDGLEVPVREDERVELAVEA